MLEVESCGLMVVYHLNSQESDQGGWFLQRGKGSEKSSARYLGTVSSKAQGVDVRQHGLDAGSGEDGQCLE